PRPGGPPSRRARPPEDPPAAGGTVRLGGCLGWATDRHLTVGGGPARPGPLKGHCTCGARGLSGWSMATKAERYRAEQERSGPKKTAKPRRRRDTPSGTASPGVSAADRKAGGTSTAARNRSKHAAKKATYA